MKRILITGAGGSPAINFVRSLRMADEPFHLIGVDSNKYYLPRAETDERYLIPRASEPDYIAVMRQIVEETGTQLVFAQPDVEIGILSEKRDELPAMTFWPRHETVVTCQDKYLAYGAWQEAGLPVPETRWLETPADLKGFLDEHGDAWLRAVKGAAGKGSFHTDSFEQGKTWVDFNGGWGSFTAAEYLSPQSVTWQSIWNHGELVVAQGRKRLYWEFADRAPSGITGITGGAITVADPVVDELSQRAVLAIDAEPKGIFSVDMTYNRRGEPCLTEINIARFFTTHLFFTKAGLNMPHIFVRLAFGEEPPPFGRKLNPLPEGLAWIRGMDMEPVLTDVGAISDAEEELRARRSKIGRVGLALQ
jgi:carbamoyl-phosphate synthase large subunit